MFNPQAQQPQAQPQQQEQPHVGEGSALFGQATPQDVDAFYKNIHENVMQALSDMTDKQQTINAQPKTAIQNNPQKVQWIKQYQHLNPNTPQDEASKTYDYYVAPKEQGTSPIQDQLKAIDEYYKASKNEIPQSPKEQDPDNSDYGYDHTDKISALGTLMTTGRVGVESTMARFVQLSEKLGEKIKLSPPGSEKMFTDWYNKQLAKDKLYQDAVNAHPVIAAIGEFGGQILPQLLMPVGEIAKGAQVAAKGIGALATKLSPEAAAVLKNTVEPIAAKVGASTLWGRVPQLAGTAARGALIGELQYDPSGDNSVRQGLTGAVLNLALHGGGKLIQGLGSKLTQAVQDVADKYNITLPIHPGLEKATAYIPFTGMKALLRQRGEEIGNIGTKIGNQILAEAGDDSYGAALHGEVLKEFENNNSKVGNLSNKLVDIAQNSKLKVNLDTLKGVADDELSKELSLDQKIQNPDILQMGKQFSSFPKSMDYASANATRQRIGQLVDQYEKGYRTGSVNPSQKYVVNKLYGAISIDMDNFADRVGGDMKNINAKRNDLYINSVLPFKKGKYSKYLAPDYDTDKFIGDFLKPNQNTRASTLIDLLPKDSDRGLTAARAAIINHALDTATIPGVGVNAEKFINGALKLGSVNKILYTPEQLGSLEGYQKLINLTKNLSPATFKPESLEGTGLSKLFHGGIMGAAIWHPHIVLPILATGNVMARVMTSETGRKALLKVAKLSGRASNKEFMPLLKNILNIAALNIGSSLSQE